MSMRFLGGRSFRKGFDKVCLGIERQRWLDYGDPRQTLHPLCSLWITKCWRNWLFPFSGLIKHLNLFFVMKSHEIFIFDTILSSFIEFKVSIYNVLISEYLLSIYKTISRSFRKNICNMRDDRRKDKRLETFFFHV